MLKRLQTVNSLLTLLSHSLLHEREERGIDRTFELPKCFVNVVSDRAFWQSNSDVIDVYEFVRSGIGLFESDKSWINIAYASILSIRIHIKECTVLK